MIQTNREYSVDPEHEDDQDVQEKINPILNASPEARDAFRTTCKESTNKAGREEFCLWLSFLTSMFEGHCSEGVAWYPKS